MSVKVDVEFQVGETVTVMPMGGCRGKEKVIASIDEIHDRIHFTDGTSYHHADEACEGMTLLWSGRRPAVLIPDTQDVSVFEAAQRLGEWFDAPPGALNVVARHDYGDEKHLLVRYRGHPPARRPDTFDNYPVVYEAGRAAASPQVKALIRWRDACALDNYGDELLMKVYHSLVERQQSVPEEHQAALAELAAADDAYDIIKDVLIEAGSY